eukprot:c21050_g2_i1.p1 GENE.c21050_g2_i1~~c21050_g2_i1.p1  ORF type:complete len:799 (-),score=380.26 c21050_g2_i1:17-2389(-)
MEEDFAFSLYEIQDKKHWLLDDDVPKCMNCESDFTLTHRRHHCRACGGIYCSKCCGNKRTLTHIKIYSPELVCDSCFSTLEERVPLKEVKTFLGETLKVDQHGYPIKPKPHGVWENGILWNSSSVGKLIATFDEKIQTAYDIFQRTLQLYPERPSVGERPVLTRGMVEDPKDPKKKFEKLTLGEYSFKSYRQWGKRIKDLGCGVMSLASLTPQSRVLIYAETQADWMTAAFAAFSHNLTVVTAYATLGADGAAFAIDQTQTSLVFVDAKLVKVLSGIHSKCKTLKYIVALGDIENSVKETFEKSGIIVRTIEEVIALGIEHPIEPTPPSKDDTAVIMFTSGTTGNPKGVNLLHSCLVCAASGLEHEVGLFISEFDIYIAYLPLAHIMEIATELVMILKGSTIGYGTPHTLTNTGVKLAKGELGDMIVLKPTIVVFAPLVLERIYTSVQNRISGFGKIKSLIFDRAFSGASKNFEAGKLTPPAIWNKLLFKKIQASAGGNLKVIVTGSAPLDENVHKFIQICFGCPVRQGYGATETSACSFVQEVSDNKTNSVGPPRVGCCMKLVDWEEGGYRFTDKDNPAIGKPRGEIVIGGHLVANYYMINPECPDEELVEKNKTDFFCDENGIRWFYTGDIGQVDEDGCLQIIDRKKDLVKLQQGEYVALSKVEGVLKLSAYVDNALVHVKSSESYCTALVCPNVQKILAFASSQNLSNDLDQLYRNPVVVKEVYDSIVGECKGKLVSFEIPKRIGLVLAAQTWSPENDLLTAAMKLKRKPIINAHQSEIDALYTKGE